MQEYICPQCAKRYNISKERPYCDKCKQPLIVIGGSFDNSHVIGSVPDPTKPVPKCPTCGSTAVEKISLTQKAVGGALFGLFSSNVRNTMHCKNCGYKW